MLELLEELPIIIAADSRKQTRDLPHDVAALKRRCQPCPLRPRVVSSVGPTALPPVPPAIMCPFDRFLPTHTSI